MAAAQFGVGGDGQVALGPGGCVPGGSVGHGGGEGTVKTHVNHVFTKLRLRDLAAAVVFAFDHDLVTRD